MGLSVFYAAVTEYQRLGSEQNFIWLIVPEIGKSKIEGASGEELLAASYHAQWIACTRAHERQGGKGAEFILLSGAYCDN